jgi:hypothetical protein
MMILKQKTWMSGMIPTSSWIDLALIIIGISVILFTVLAVLD